jgi:uncharacterized membrane protein YeaQ/YmgE (transglycosylase-associated protein family)
MQVKHFLLAILIAVVVGLLAEYIMRGFGIASMGGTIGGLAGILAAMIMNKRK